ncbi:sugar ABC transporter substrate-binding protein [Desulfotruncus alcoholivorax]|uniref:sugar ABC transporter substrate-binding protein n=1 Tax=Desulfotruncus alcoholivorax TaxID=265477 RepID=UPI00040FF202|nr:substrate-binding domain-containing protein [Desulfotruncus alcoholivorax]
MNKIRPVVIALVSVLMLLLAASGCGKREPLRKPAERPVKIGFALADLNRDGNKTIKKTVDGSKKKVNAEITWLDAGNDPAKQQKQLQQLAGKKLKAVVFQPVDPAAAPAMVEQLARRGIKVVVLENLPVNTPVDGYIASDHDLVGRLQARFLTEALQRAQEARKEPVPPPTGTPGQGGGGQQGGSQGSSPGGGTQGSAAGASSTSPGGAGGTSGQITGAVDYTVVAQLPGHRPLNVLILRGDPRDQAAREITAALEAALQGQKDINIIGVYDHPLWDPASVPATLAKLKSRNEKVDAILANDSGLAMAAVDYLKMGGFDKNVLTVGVGADEKASQALVKG